MAFAAWPAMLLATRIAIVSSSNEAGGQATPHYAHRDGARVAAVLSELGSFAAPDIWTLPDVTVSSLRAALERAERLAADEPGSAIFFYYSGHADGEGLLLGPDKFTYRELRERLTRSRAQVRVAVLDACNSGGATAAKGGRPAPSPTFAAVDPERVKGAAILAASRAEELAQESSDLAGSYFTHYLVSGLRGAGDRDGDGVVTLAEAYAYVYARTLAATAPSLWGPQHASYDYQLSGTGDLVLTTLRRGRQGLTFAPGGPGPYTVLDAHREVVAEVQSDPRRTSRLALPAGRYRVVLHDGGRLYTTEVALASDADVAVERASLREVSAEYALAKGGPPVGIDGVFADYALAGRGVDSAGISAELGLTFRHRWPTWSLGARLGYGETNPEDVGLVFRLRRYSAAAVFLRRLTTGPVEVHLGGTATVTHVSEQGARGRTLSANVPGAAATLALEVPLGHRLTLRFAWDLGVELLPIDGTFESRPVVRAGLGLGVRR